MCHDMILVYAFLTTLYMCHIEGFMGSLTFFVKGFGLVTQSSSPTAVEIQRMLTLSTRNNEGQIPLTEHIVNGL